MKRIRRLELRKVLEMGSKGLGRRKGIGRRTKALWQVQGWFTGYGASSRTDRRRSTRAPPACVFVRERENVGCKVQGVGVDRERGRRRGREREREGVCTPGFSTCVRTCGMTPPSPQCRCCPSCLRGQGLGFRVYGSGFRVWGLGFGVWGLGFGVWGLGVEVWGLGFGVQGSGFRVQGSGFGVQGSGFRG